MIDLGDGTFISAQRAQTRVRGGGFGANAWLARITGTDPRYTFRRAFLQPDRSGLSGSGRSGAITWEVPSPGLYEWRAFCVGSTTRNWRSDGFCRIDPDGTVARLDRDAALTDARILDQDQNTAREAP